VFDDPEEDVTGRLVTEGFADADGFLLGRKTYDIFANYCAEERLVDEYRLFIYPVLLGSGKRFFGSGTVPVALRQAESVTISKGATYHRFERSGKTEYGQMGT
jgi:dihydrofolate reductase